MLILLGFAPFNTVEPVVNITFSPSEIGFGDSGMVACTARGYPTPNPDTNFKIQHPANCNVTLSTEDGAVIHTINNAEKHDFGEYICHVDISVPDIKDTLTGTDRKTLGKGKRILFLNYLN